MNRWTAALRSEYRKITSTRLWWILIGAAVLYLGVMAFGLGAAFAVGANATSANVQALPMPADQVPGMLYSLGASLGFVFPLTLGTIAMTGEYRYRTMEKTLLSEPRRSVVLGSKLIANAGLGVIYGAAISIACLGGGALALIIFGHDADLADPTTWRNFAFTIIALALWAVVGVGFGAVVTNQVAAIVIILAWAQIVEPIVRMGLSVVPALAPAAKFLPGAAGEALAGGDSLYSAAGLASGMLSWWQGGLVLLAYGLLLALIGRVTTMRRDVG